ncbi:MULTISPECIES: hypothetical protein [unclassified Pseudoxanthomonas]|uniref:hypothetical protein n=1 Tax=unclassified Pseudoxanthomonas TaxID=2645906 RepID=UPI0030781062
MAGSPHIQWLVALVPLLAAPVPRWLSQEITAVETTLAKDPEMQARRSNVREPAMGGNRCASW